MTEKCILEETSGEGSYIERGKYTPFEWACLSDFEKKYDNRGFNEEIVDFLTDYLELERKMPETEMEYFNCIENMDYFAYTRAIAIYRNSVTEDSDRQKIQELSIKAHKYSYALKHQLNSRFGVMHPNNCLKDYNGELLEAPEGKRLYRDWHDEMLRKSLGTYFETQEVEKGE